MCWLLVSSLAAAHAEQISHRAYWVDASGGASYSQAREQDYQAFSGAVSLGFTSAAIWLRLHIEPFPEGSTESQIALHIRPVFLDEIKVYDPLSATPEVPQVTGESYPVANSALPSLSHNLLIPAAAQPRDIYVRLHTDSSSLIEIQALTIKAFESLDRRQGLVYSFDLALQILLWLWVFLTWFGERDNISRLFLVKQGLLIGHASAIFGYHRIYLEPWLGASVLESLFDYGTVTSIFVSIYFEYAFIRVYHLPTVSRRLMLGLVCATALNLGWMALGNTQSALRFGNLAVLTAPLLLLWIALHMKPAKDERGVQYQLKTTWVVGYYLVLATLLVVIALANAGKITFNEIAMNASIAYSLVSGALMTLLLQYRTQQIRRHNQELARALEIESRQSAIERAHQAEQKHFLYMLMHELKTPLAVINMSHTLAQGSSSSSPRATPTSRAIADMKSIIDRCMEFDQLHEASAQVRAERVDLAHVIEEIAGKYQGNAQTWDLQCTPDAVLVTDRHYLTVILNNLVDNAVRYSTPDTALTIAIHPHADASGKAGIEMLIGNRPGLAAWPDPDKVFQKYYRSSGAMKQSGTGLGLFLVANLARRLGGICRYVPDSTHVRFSLWLPL